MEQPVKPIKKRASTRRLKGSPLNEQDWVSAAIEILVNENVRGIRIDVLCAKLGVTKGSFYWHFATRNDLLVAVLSTWRRKTTMNVIKSISASSGTARDRLRRLLWLPRGPKSPASAQVEQSVRDWARRVEMPKSAVAEVDQIRMDYFTQLVKDAGHDGDEARVRAYIMYCLMMGDSILHQSLSDVPHDTFLDTVMELVIDKDRTPDSETS